MARTLSYILGAIMVVAGLLGFALGTSVLGIFTAAMALSSLWLVAGLITLVVALFLPAHIMLWDKAMGIVLAILAVLGFVMNGAILTYFDNTMANNILHLVLAAVFLAAGFIPMGSSMDQPLHMPAEPASL
jgi:hypothetical protein